MTSRPTSLTPLTWIELVVPDVDQVEGHYRDQFGWTAVRVGDRPRRYGWLAGSRIIAGARVPDPVAPTPPAWLPYVGCPDVPAMVARAVDAGAGVVMPPGRVSSGLTVAVVTGPCGEPLGLTSTGRPAPRRLVAGRAGSLVELNLVAAEVERSCLFYSVVVGWQWSRASGAVRSSDVGGVRLTIRPPASPSGDVLLRRWIPTFRSRRRVHRGHRPTPLQVVDPAGARYAVI